MTALIDEALAFGRGLLIVRDDPELRHRVRRAVTAGELRRILPGVYRPADAPPTLRDKGRALMAFDSTAVLTGRAAACLHGWEDDEPDLCTAISRRRTRAPGFALAEGSLPDPLVISLGGVRVTERSLTALDLVPDRGGSAIDDALRRGVRLEAMWDALERTPQRPGNEECRRLLHDSRDRPWSEAERRAHQVLRTAGITGWAANVPVRAGGRRAFCDIGFARERLAVEIDGRAHHEGWEHRVRDCARDRRLAREGWLVIRFPAAMVLNDPDAFVDDLLAARAGRRPVRVRTKCGDRVRNASNAPDAAGRRTSCAPRTPLGALPTPLDVRGLPRTPLDSPPAPAASE